MKLNTTLNRFAIAVALVHSAYAGQTAQAALFPIQIPGAEVVSVNGQPCLAAFAVKGLQVCKSPYVNPTVVPGPLLLQFLETKFSATALAQDLAQKISEIAKVDRFLARALLLAIWQLQWDVVPSRVPFILSEGAYQLVWKPNQISVRLGSVVSIDKDLWDRLPRSHQAGTVIFEALLALSRPDTVEIPGVYISDLEKFRAINAAAALKGTGHVFSENWESTGLKGLQVALRTGPNNAPQYTNAFGEVEREREIRARSLLLPGPSPRFIDDDFQITAVTQVNIAGDEKYYAAILVDLFKKGLSAGPFPESSLSHVSLFEGFCNELKRTGDTHFTLRARFDFLTGLRTTEQRLVRPDGAPETEIKYQFLGRSQHWASPDALFRYNSEPQEPIEEFHTLPPEIVQNTSTCVSWLKVKVAAFAEQTGNALLTEAEPLE